MQGQWWLVLGTLLVVAVAANLSTQSRNSNIFVTMSFQLQFLKKQTDVFQI